MQQIASQWQTSTTECRKIAVNRVSKDCSKQSVEKLQQSVERLQQSTTECRKIAAEDNRVSKNYNRVSKDCSRVSTTECRKVATEYNRVSKYCSSVWQNVAEQLVCLCRTEKADESCGRACVAGGGQSTYMRGIVIPMPWHFICRAPFGQEYHKGFARIQGTFLRPFVVL